MREKFALKPFYKKIRLVEEFPIVASEKVPDAALDEAAAVIHGMLGKRSDILKKLAENKCRLAIMGVAERTCDVPEHADLTPPAYWNKRARGLGATSQRPAVSCGEENLLHNAGDPYSTESIMVHEFSHAIHQMAVVDLDTTFQNRLDKTYRSALAKGLWKKTYAATNSAEYWAEGVQSWFDTNRQNDALHNDVDTREELQKYDPGLAKLCAEVFGENPWRYVRADHPSRQGEAHLKGLDRSKLGKFTWSEAETKAYEALPEKDG
jgi:hypothetical protein